MIIKWRKSCDVGSRAHSPIFPSLHLRRCSFSNLSVTSPTSLLILQPFRHFTYVTARSPTLPSLYLRHISFSNPSVASPTSQLILQPFFRFSYATGSSLTSPGEPPVCPLCSILCCFRRWPWHCTEHTFREACSCVSVQCSGPQSVAPSTGIWSTGIWVASPGGLNPTLGKGKS